MVPNLCSSTPPVMFNVFVFISFNLNCYLFYILTIFKRLSLQ